MCKFVFILYSILKLLTYHTFFYRLLSYQRSNRSGFLAHPVCTFFVDRPTGQTARRIFTHDGSDNAASRKGQTFSGIKVRS